MKKDVKILVANPAGNITVFVLDKFERAAYQSVAKQLLEIDSLKGEQVAFVTGEDSMEMCGLEFCGNASRSFALMLAKERGVHGSATIDVSVSGCNEKLSVLVDTLINYTKIKMPEPTDIFTLQNTGIAAIDGCKYVSFGGIGHVIVNNVEPKVEIFNEIKEYINRTYNPPAMGVMFYDTAKHMLTPVVYVKDVDTTYFEGSCGSGTTAVAIAYAYEEKNGTFSFTLPQPAGTITSTVQKTNGKLDAVYIEGTIQLGDIIHAKIDC